MAIGFGGATARWLSVGISVLLLSSGAAWAQSPELRQNNERGVELYQQGKLQDALPYLINALRLSEIEFGATSPNTVPHLRNLTDLHWALGNYDAAEPLFMRLLSILEAHLGPNDIGLTHVLSYLSTLYGANARYDEAETLYVRLLGILESELGPDHPNVAQVLSNFSAIYAAQRQYDRAEALLLRSYAIYEGVDNPDPRRMAMAAYNLASVYEYMNEPAQARPYYQRALDLWQAEFGLGHANAEAVRQRLAQLGRDPADSPASVVTVRAGSTTPAPQAPPDGQPAMAEIKAPVTPEETAEETEEAVETEVAAAPPPPVAPPPAAVSPPPPVPAAAVPATPTGFRVQVASLKNPDQSAHRSEWNRLQRLHGDLLGTLDMTVARVDLGPDRGVYHRLHAGPLSESEARTLCAALAERDAGCQLVAP